MTLSQASPAEALPAVSIVMPAHNAAAHLHEAVDSLLSQTLSDFELIIVDDASTDDTAAIAFEYAEKDYRVRVIQAPECLGCSGARNTGLEAARAELIVFHDADDYSLPNRLQVQRDYLEAHPEAGAVFNSHTIFDYEGNTVATKVIRWNARTMAALLRRTYYLHHCAGMFRTDLVKRIGGYRAHLDICEDWDLLLRFAEQFPLGVMRESMYMYRMHPENTVVRHRALMAVSANVVINLRKQREQGGAEHSTPPAPRVRQSEVASGRMRRYFWALTKMALGEGEYRNTVKYLRRFLRTGPAATAPKAAFILLAIPIRATLQALGLVKWVERVFQGK